MMITKEIIEIGSGNVFADLGFPEAEEEQAKAQLAHKLLQSLSTTDGHRQLLHLCVGSIIVNLNFAQGVS